VSVFRRRGNRDAEAAAADPQDTSPEGGDQEALDADVDSSVGTDAEPGDPQGPWDAADLPDTDGYVDLGGIRLKGRDGMELRLEVEEATGNVTAATVQLQGSAVQLQAFAAPRNSGIWDEIREEIAAQVTKQGGTADEVPGAFGRELIARIPVRSSDGRTGHQPARFAGVDGPRWFLRAVFHGPAVHEPEAAALLESVVREVVVVRGGEAMAPRELLTLRLPDAAQPEPEPEQPDDPFRRGPEITEIR